MVSCAKKRAAKHEAKGLKEVSWLKGIYEQLLGVS